MAFEFRLPDIGEGVVEGEIVTWLVRVGETVEEDQPMVEVMTDKATVEIPSPLAGTVIERRGNEGDIVPVGDVLVIIDSEASADAPATPSPKGTRQTPPPAESEPPSEDAEVSPQPAPPSPRLPARPDPTTRVKATPAVRRLARETGVDLAAIAGSGANGRITREDVVAAGAAGQSPSSTPAPKPAGVSSTPSGAIDTIPYRGLRRRIGEQMSRSKLTAPHFAYVEEVDVSELVSLRHKFNEAHPEQRLTFLPFIMKAVVSGLLKYPIVNAMLDEDKGEIQLRKYYNLGIATATDNGLVVPVVKGVDRASLLEISSELTRVSEDARQGRSKLEDLQDSTFTITSLGALGGILATPIINYPEVAILGVHKIVPRPVVRDGQIVVRDIMNLSISLDHRVVDGAVGAQFMQHVVELIEDPGLLLIG